MATMEGSSAPGDTQQQVVIAMEAPAPVLTTKPLAKKPLKFAVTQQTLTQVGAAFVVGVGITLLPKVLRAVLRRGKKTTPAPQPQPQPQQHVPVTAPVQIKAGPRSPVELTPFGSPVDPGTPVYPGDKTKSRVNSNKAKDLDVDQDSTNDKDQKVDHNLVQQVSQLQEQLKVLQQLQQENSKLKEFLQSYVSDSEKIKALEKENETLKSAKDTLQGQLEDFKTKNFLFVSSGEELEKFKLAVRVPNGAKSVCSDAGTNNFPSTMSVDGRAHPDVRKRQSTLERLFGKVLGMPELTAAGQHPQRDPVALLESHFSGGGAMF